MKILIVEDNRSSQIALARMLHGTEHDIHVVMNGEEALWLLLAETFDVVVTDYRMPTMGGLELTGIIRRLFGNQVVVVGVSASEDCQQQFLEAGANAFLEKPVERQELLEIIEHESRERICPHSIAQ